MDSSSSCPFCDQVVPSKELQRHANGHFEDEDNDDKQRQLARDFELAQQMALSSTPYDNDNQETIKLKGSLDSGKLSCERGALVKEKLNVDEKISSLIGLQNRSGFYKVEGGLMSLLRNCLELESSDSTSVVSGYVDHYQSIEFEDLGWGCGWRNIQMLCSHLIMQRPEARNVLFGGSGVVPDILSLQRWLEIAWKKGFDVHGAEHFNYKIYGRKNWIGATECAALLRSFGLQARIVDFGPKECEELYLSVPGSSSGAQMVNLIDANKRKTAKVNGPMDRFLVSKNDGVPQTGSSGHEKSKYSRSVLENKSTQKAKGHQVLVDWVWNYFSDGRICTYSHQHVNVSGKTPLFFQHDGHSRTIVGIQVKQQRNGMQQYNLLILDPAHSTKGIEKSLRENNGWQKLIKRGTHTLNKPQYQLCYIDSGIAAGADLELLKKIDSLFLEL
ncbi:zinc finger with UFM1-specific peptidase domain protein isoform X1 [Cucurbita pepo subsp. pepo]|uniref:zinc finger with UFM1-specific peptidase domain protein isoform X1 n=2 Tax=Cucurbita pepo subsp. pepo TaxID=3664 RepID=UPI000C9D5C48|nr:zinc finger with UFM1-specific peptidase domain protein isoform X1 [Cucurbita pepo subsp. pepo]